MGSVLMAVGAFVAYIIAYKTYGRFISKRLFGLDDSRTTAAVECEDGVDYVPTKAEILFGHHYTSIAGTGPIVGPAAIMFVITGWAMVHNICGFAGKGVPQLHLLVISMLIVGLELWMVVEAVMVLVRPAVPAPAAEVREPETADRAE